VREQVRTRYAAAAVAIGHEARAGASGVGTTDRSGRHVFGSSLYAENDREDAPVAGSLGCGVPTAVADLTEGETVLDLGSVSVPARSMTGTSLTEPAGTPGPPAGQARFYLVQPILGGVGAGYGTETAPLPRIPSACEGGCP